MLYTSLAREGSLAEISFHWSRMTPRPTKPLMLHTLGVAAHRTLKLVRADLAALGVPERDYGTINLPRSQEIGAAVECARSAARRMRAPGSCSAKVCR